MINLSGNIKRCIFHTPNYVDNRGISGSNVRPYKMMQAFKEIGYEVDIVTGYAKERKKKINEIKRNIKNGVKYEFVYSESSTMPTLLTEKHHLPTYPFLDFSFLKFCKKNGLKIGLFYRDIHWRFPKYKRNVSFMKRSISIPMYKYDLRKYKEILDVLYLASESVAKFIPEKFDKTLIKALPPGSIYNEDIINSREKHFSVENRVSLNIFYVGGIGETYNITSLLKAVSSKEFVNLVICCRKNEWENNKKNYEKYLNDRIKIVHASGKELEKYYNEADMCSLFFNLDEYMKMSMPIKLFEYLSHVTPIIATKGSSGGDFVKNNNIGWVLDYESSDLENLLDNIIINQKMLKEKYSNSVVALNKNLWINRARQVEIDLVNNKQ